MSVSVDVCARSSSTVALRANSRLSVNAVAARYKVDPATVVAVWGVESNFGRNFGSRLLIDRPLHMDSAGIPFCYSLQHFCRRRSRISGNHLYSGSKCTDRYSFISHQ